MPDGSAQVAVIDEESEEFDDDMLDAEIDQIDMEEDDFFDEYVLEQMANDGMLAEPEPEPGPEEEEGEGEKDGSKISRMSGI